MNINIPVHIDVLRVDWSECEVARLLSTFNP